MEIKRKISSLDEEINVKMTVGELLILRTALGNQSRMELLELLSKEHQESISIGLKEEVREGVDFRVRTLGAGTELYNTMTNFAKNAELLND